MIRRFRPEDAAPTRAVFFAAVRIGAAEHYTQAELIDWVAAPDMPDGWGEWLDGHITFVSETAQPRGGTAVTGFMMLEASGYLNMAFVLPDYRRTGLADQLYGAILDTARGRGMTQMTVLASRLAERFFARHGWRHAPDLAEDLGAIPQNTAMALVLTASD